MAQADARTLEFEGKIYALDEHGFLDPPEQWDEAFAGGIARQLGIDALTLEHWAIIYYLRRKFLEEGTVPLVVYACAENNLRLSRLRFLFPAGYHRGACRIAGINYDFMYQANIWHTYESYSDLASEYPLTAAGFLKEFERWDERYAQIVASEWNLPRGLTRKHWRIIYYLRDFYRRTGNIPTVWQTCKVHSLPLARMRELFPDGYRRGACRIAGLPFFA